MPRLAANLSTLFTELPFLERFGAAAAAGFTRVEYQFPYGLAAAEAIGARARAAGCHQLNCLAGLRVIDSTHEQQMATLVENLSYAADQLQTAGMTLLIEPLNAVTMPAFLLSNSAEAMAVIKAAQRLNLRLQYDLFQMQMAEGNLATTIEGLLPYIGHMQIAGVPGRHEPDRGELDYGWLLEHIDRLGYRGAIGCEYHPRGATLAGLAWARPYLASTGTV